MSDNLQLILRAVQEFDINVARAVELIEIDREGEFNYDLLPYGAGTRAIFSFDEIPVQKYKEVLAERDALARDIRTANKNLFDTQEAAKTITKQAIAAEAERDALAARLAELEGQYPVFAFRRRGLPDFCTCTEGRYAELAEKPHLFEVRKLYARPVPAEPVNARLLEALKRAKNSLVAFKLVPGGANCWEASDEENLTAVNSAIAAAEAQQVSVLAHCGLNAEIKADARVLHLLKVSLPFWQHTGSKLR